MQQTTLKELPALLSDKLRDCRESGKFINIAITADVPHEKHLNKILRDWAESCSLNFTFIPLPSVLYKDVGGGKYVPDLKDGERQYLFSDDVVTHINSKEVGFFEYLNWGRPKKAVEELKEIITNRTYTSPYNGIRCEINNLKMLVVTLFPERPGRKLIELDQSVVELFENYQIIDY